MTWRKSFGGDFYDISFANSEDQKSRLFAPEHKVVI
jgi:hypothetical protein